jgi:hypothetical protein
MELRHVSLLVLSGLVLELQQEGRRTGDPKLPTSA